MKRPPQPKSESSRDRGARAEELATRLIVDAGLTVVARNVALAGAELDIIVRDPEAGTIVFVEVRSRTRNDLGEPVETIGQAKRRQIVRAATTWLIREQLWEQVEVRFDVVGVVDLDGDVQVTWLRDAFDGT